VRWDRDRAVLAHHLVPVLIHELVVGIELEGAAARVALPVVRLDDQETGTGHADVEVVAGLAQGAPAHVGRRLGHRDAFIHQAGEDALTLEAVGRDVREVVGHHFLAALPVPQRALGAGHAVRGIRGEHSVEPQGGGGLPPCRSNPRAVLLRPANLLPSNNLRAKQHLVAE
jgi:hypothetical protein